FCAPPAPRRMWRRPRYPHPTHTRCRGHKTSKNDSLTTAGESLFNVFIRSLLGVTGSRAVGQILQIGNPRMHLRLPAAAGGRGVFLLRKGGGGAGSDLA